MGKEWEWWNNLTHQEQRSLVYKYYTGQVQRVDTAEVENMFELEHPIKEPVFKPRCKECGRFIGTVEFPEKVKVEFTPDTHFTTEKTEYTHKLCVN